MGTQSSARSSASFYIDANRFDLMQAEDKRGLQLIQHLTLKYLTRHAEGLRPGGNCTARKGASFLAFTDHAEPAVLFDC